ncbi:MAG: hypothetical protein H6707_11275 [Deltaproteobacteria bacterium]|nr:hypothetical protein [Deltaproteobacteria bacterium]
MKTLALLTLGCLAVSFGCGGTDVESESFAATSGPVELETKSRLSPLTTAVQAERLQISAGQPGQNATHPLAERPGICGAVGCPFADVPCEARGTAGMVLCVCRIADMLFSCR